jgi:serine protease inhibitor
MKRLAPLFVLSAAIGCGGNSSTDSNAGLYNAPNRDSRQRSEALDRATKDLTEGTAAKVVAATNDFGFRLLDQVDDGNGNVMISPVSISTALSMTLNGANGKTRDEMLKALGTNKFTVEQVNEANESTRELLSSFDPAKSTLRVANSLWVKQGVKLETDFLTKNANSYNAMIADVDLNALDGYRKINEWVKTATEGKIPTIIEEKVNPALRLVLVNAIYFKANWKDKFNKEDTKSGPFAVTAKENATVDFMNRSGSYPYIKHDWGTLVSLPYADGRTEMILGLPASGQDPQKLADKLAGQTNFAPTQFKQLLIALPKWKSTYEKELRNGLEKLGMSLAFTEKADFSLMKKDESLAISKVMHKTFIEVNEEGTEAAAATGVEVAATSAPAEPTIVRFDRQFVYAIRDTKSNQILFVGIMRNPNK